MAFTKTGLAAVSLMALLAAGCSSTRLSSMNTQPEPLQPAPSGSVTSTTALPPPAAPGTTDPAGFPEAPGTNVASITPGADRRSARPHRRERSGRLESFRLRAKLPDDNVADQVRRQQPRSVAAMRCADRRREIVERRRQGAVALRRRRFGGRPALFVRTRKIRWTDLDRIAYLAQPVDRFILLSVQVTDAPA